MWSLFKNEWIKLWAKKQHWTFAAAIIIIAIFAAFMYGSFAVNDEMQSEDWRTQMEQEIEQKEQVLATPDIDDWERDMAEQIIAENQAHLSSDVNPYLMTNVKYMNEMLPVIASFITLFSVVAASSIVSSEIQSGTIKQLVIRPFERWQFLLSKFLTVTVFSLLLVIILIVSNYVISTLLFGNGDWTAQAPMHNGNEASYVTLIFSQMGLYTLNMLVFVVISFSLSTLFKSQALAVGIGIFVLFFTNMTQMLTMVLGDTAWYKFVILPHLSLPQYTYTNTIMEGVTLPFSLAVLAVYVIIFLSITTVFFQKRDIA